MPKLSKLPPAHYSTAQATRLLGVRPRYLARHAVAGGYPPSFVAGEGIGTVYGWDVFDVVAWATAALVGRTDPHGVRALATALRKHPREHLPALSAYVGYGDVWTVALLAPLPEKVSKGTVRATAVRVSLTGVFAELSRRSVGADFPPPHQFGLLPDAA